MRQLSFNYITPVKKAVEDVSKRIVVFIKPFGGKLYRVYTCPQLPPSIDVVLNKLCTHYHKGVWYFRIPDEETRLYVAAHLVNIDADHVFIEPDPL